MIKKLMQFFGKKEEAVGDSGKTGTFGGLKDLENFVDYIVRALVDQPESVKIESGKLEDSSTVIRINCAKDDIGKVIGRNGKTIMAIRSLVSGAGGRLGQRLSVEVID